MPSWVVGKVEDALNTRGRAINGSNIMVLGIAYKKDTNDTRESPGLNILAMLQSKGAKAIYHDPHVPSIPPLRDYDLKGDSVALEDKIISNQHCVVLCTDHSGVNYEKLGRLSDLIIDTRGVFPRILTISYPHSSRYCEGYYVPSSNKYKCCHSVVFRCFKNQNLPPLVAGR